MRYPLTLLAALVFLSISAEEIPVHQAGDVTVTARPPASVQRVGQDTSVASSLATVPGISVITQGVPVGQTDLSIRGSGFSGAGLSIAGLPLRNAQTEHFHAELPIPGAWLGSPQVLTGVSQAAQSEGHLTGTVAFTPLPVNPGSRLTAGLDNQDGYWISADHQERLAETIGLGIHVGHTEIPSVDLGDNDVEASRVALRTQLQDGNGQADLLIGHQEKTFGVRGYYGVSDTLPAEETTRDTLALGSWQSYGPGNTSASILLREFDDDYRLWLPTSLFRNQHTTRTAVAQASHTFSFTDHSHLLARLAGEIEEIDSTALGDFDRSRLTTTLISENELSDAFRLRIGAVGEILEGDDDQLLPLARIEFRPSDRCMGYLEYSESLRRPSYTELNYESPGSLGNAGLEVQDQQAWETGFEAACSDRTRIQAALFHHRTTDTVDWVRPDAAATRWQAENIGRVDTLGAEASVQHELRDRLNVIFRYQWLEKDTDDAPYASRYFLDYARHLATARIDWMASENVRVELSQHWRQQEDNVLRTEGGNEQWWTEVAFHLRTPGLPHVQWSLMAVNALDDDYRTFPGQDTVSNRRVSASVTMDW